MTEKSSINRWLRRSALQTKRSVKSLAEIKALIGMCTGQYHFRRTSEKLTFYANVNGTASDLTLITASNRHNHLGD